MRVRLTPKAIAFLGPQMVSLPDQVFQKTLELRANSARSRFLAVEDIRQKYSNWCWAALSASLGRFHVPSGIEPCEIAHAWLHHRDCDDDPVVNARTSICDWQAATTYYSTTEPPNQPQVLDEPLRVAQTLRRVAIKRGKPSLAAIRKQIEDDCPLPLLIKWIATDGSKSGGHFVAIIGYFPDEGKLLIQDPHLGQMDVDYDTFPNSYFSHGDLSVKSRWTRTYWMDELVQRSDI